MRLVRLATQRAAGQSPVDPVDRIGVRFRGMLSIDSKGFVLSIDALLSLESN
jgi:hypothetical protein